MKERWRLIYLPALQNYHVFMLDRLRVIQACQIIGIHQYSKENVA